MILICKRAFFLHFSPFTVLKSHFILQPSRAACPALPQWLTSSEFVRAEKKRCYPDTCCWNFHSARSNCVVSFKLNLRPQSVRKQLLYVFSARTALQAQFGGGAVGGICLRWPIIKRRPQCAVQFTWEFLNSLLNYWSWNYNIAYKSRIY